ncbi:UV excision repair protein Rad23 [Neoconidiobolus thromboides FSU 785]|nr:UV excision repair protein Rad23 [Neoconidiobolus thromboides FSU 785]
MQVKFKDLGMKEFLLELEGSMSVLETKQLIEKERGCSVEAQKLIYKGKILNDTETIEQSGINEQGFVVLMVKKMPKSVSTPAVKQETSQPQTKPEQEIKAESTNETSSNIIGEQLEGMINNFLEMGFDREQIDQAMRAAFNNPERAAEYLLNGIPDELIADLTSQNNAASSQVGEEALSSDANTTNATIGENLNQNLFQAAAEQASRNHGQRSFDTLIELRNSPQLRVIREAVRENPSLIQPILQQMARSNPEILHHIQENPELLALLLEENLEDLEIVENEDGEHGQGQNQQLAQPHQITITQEENEAILRLEALGFNRERAIQAYFVCDKNEEIAANYLFDNQDED